jgi:hypothetical protein
MKGRPKGATNRPQFHTYTTELDRREYVIWVKENYKKDPQLAKWYGDQLFGKAVQPLGNDNGQPLILQFDNAFTQQTEGNS